MGFSTESAITRKIHFLWTASPLPISRAKSSRTRLPLDSFQSLEVIAGAPPAEYGDKTSLMINVTTRSGIGETTPHGSVDASYGAFGSVQGGSDFDYGGQKWGNFIAVSGLNIGRFLDPPEFSVMHDKGNRGKCIRSRGLSVHHRGLPPLEFPIHAFLVSDARTLSTPRMPPLVRSGRAGGGGVGVDNGGFAPVLRKVHHFGILWRAGGPGRPTFENSIL